LAGVLRAAHLNGLPWSRMAVLVRSTALTLGPLRRAMMTAGVPVAVRGEDIPLAEQPAVALLLTLLAAVYEPAALDEDVAEALLTSAVGGGDSVYLRRLRRVLRASFPDEDGALVPVLTDRLGAEQLPEHVRRPVLRVARTLAAGVQAREAGGDTEVVLWALWEATALARRWESASLGGGPAGAAADRDLDAVVQLFDEVARFTDRLPHEGAAAFLDYVRAQQLPGASGVSRSDPDAVAVLTAQEGAWPDLRRRGSLLGAEQLVDVLRGIDTVEPGSHATQLAEERRLFYVAATRARGRLVVTAVTGEEEQPSRLLDELDPSDGDRPLARAPMGVHLPGLVAELRAVVCSPDAPDSDRNAAAAQLARLAAADVPGADPDDWWGLAQLSTTGPTVPAERRVRVSPSRVESFLECELRALMQTLGVRDDSAVAATLGTVIHDLLATAPEDLTLPELEARLDELWGDIRFDAAWFADNERVRARKMLERYAEWLRSSRASLQTVGVELDFSVEVGDAVVAGRVDRLERDADGRLIVIDLKTGKNKPSDVSEHPQLGAYQLAIANGAFAEHGTEPGGAMLVQLGTSGATEQLQPPLAEAENPDWVREHVEHVASRMRGYQFDAIDNRRCHICDVRSSCPLQVVGRQVTQ
jgi:RecB family exonuclease